MSYTAVVREKKYHRCVTASLSHVSVLHLLFNMSTLWSCGVVEAAGGGTNAAYPWGSGWYARLSALMLLGTCGIVLAIARVLVIARVRGEEHERVTAVGYSAVVFGWMTILSVKRPTSALVLFGGAVHLPVNLAPFASLACTSIVVPRASFVGHLAGIAMGYLIAWDLFAWFNWGWCVAVVVAVGVVAAKEARGRSVAGVAGRLADGGGGGGKDAAFAGAGSGRRLGGGETRENDPRAIARALRGSGDDRDVADERV
jgi:membrane associated rhomboid family serine protease